MTRDELAGEFEKRIGRTLVEEDRQHTFGGFVPLPKERLIELGIYRRRYLWAHKLVTNRNSLGEQVSKTFLVEAAQACIRQHKTAISWGNAEADKQNAQHQAAYEELLPLFEALVEDTNA
jgi:hypothetical protein